MPLKTFLIWTAFFYIVHLKKTLCYKNEFYHNMNICIIHEITEKTMSQTTFREKTKQLTIKNYF